MEDAFDLALKNVDYEKEHPYGDAFDQGFDESQEEEPWYKSLARTALQIPKGVAQATTYGITTGLMSMLGTGDALDPEEIEHIKMIQSVKEFHLMNKNIWKLFKELLKHFQQLKILQEE